MLGVWDEESDEEILAKGHKLPVISSEDLMHRMVSIANDTVANDT